MSSEQSEKLQSPRYIKERIRTVPVLKLKCLELQHWFDQRDQPVRILCLLGWYFFSLSSLELLGLIEKVTPDATGRGRER